MGKYNDFINSIFRPGSNKSNKTLQFAKGKIEVKETEDQILSRYKSKPRCKKRRGRESGAKKK